MSKKYHISGMGVASSLGNSTTEYLDSILKSKSGISLIDSYDTTFQDIKYAGTVKNIYFKDHMNRTTLRRSGRATKLGIVASRQAYNDANLSKYPKDSIALVVASGMGETIKMLEYHTLLKQKNARKAAPFFSLYTNDLMAGYISIELGIRGPNYGVSCACSSGSVAVINALGILKTFPDINAVIVCGTESLIDKDILNALYQTKMLADQNSESAELIMKPYDKNARGFVVSEGSGAIVIERSYKTISLRNNYAEIVSFAFNSDSKSMVQEADSCELKIKLVDNALRMSKLLYSDIDYINGYGSSLHHVDNNELNVINECFYKKGREPLVSSTKSMLGHSFGASAILEIISTVLSMQKSLAIPNINFTNTNKKFENIKIVNEAKDVNINYSLKLSFASGNRNTAIIFKKV